MTTPPKFRSKLRQFGISFFELLFVARAEKLRRENPQRYAHILGIIEEYLGPQKTEYVDLDEK